MASHNGSGPHAPSEFPPPVDSVKEFVKRDLDSEDERIDVGVAIVGGGTAGLATANRLLQLLGEDAEAMERLGEVPVAIIEKAKTCGGHNLSGAVMRPGPLQELFPSMSRAEIREFGLAEGGERQVWELGVKEVWKVPEPIDRVIHTIGPWPLKLSAKYGQIGGTWIYPMKDEKSGDDLVSIGFVVDLEYRDATTSAHDLLQTFKQHPLVKDILEGGERVAWGAKALPGGGYWSMPKLTMPGALLVGDAGGMVDTAALKGVHHCIKSGMLAADAIYK